MMLEIKRLMLFWPILGPFDVNKSVLCSLQVVSYRYSFPLLLGSIPELPAESCKEIKLSSEGKALSGKFWLNSIITCKAVLANCDMGRERSVELSIYALPTQPVHLYNIIIWT